MQIKSPQITRAYLCVYISQLIYDLNGLGTNKDRRAGDQGGHKFSMNSESKKMNLTKPNITLPLTPWDYDKVCTQVRKSVNMFEMLEIFFWKISKSDYNF